jgi:outer membrane protein assembly factor BamB
MRIRAVAGWAIVAVLSMLAGGCSRNGVDPNLPAITTQPTAQTAKVGATATFSVTATGAPPLAYQWFEFAKPIKGATSASYTTPTLAASDNNAFFFVLVTNSIGSIESDEVLLTVTTTTPPPTVSPNTLGNANPADVLTMRNDAARTGQYLGETLLTPANVNAARFGKLGTLITDGPIDAQPLYASGVTLPSGEVRNLLYVATEHGTVYAFDATTGAVIWQIGVAANGEQPADAGTCGNVPQEQAISATPVIDRTQGQHGAIYLIANTKDSSGTVIQRIHAIDIATGSELFGGPTPIQASAAASGGSSPTTNTFDSARYHPLAGLELANGKVYAVWGSDCSSTSDNTWAIGFDAGTLDPAVSLLLPNENIAGSEFVPGGLSADSAGNLYILGHESIASEAPNATTGKSSGSSNNTFIKLTTESGISVAAIFFATSGGTIKMLTVGQPSLSSSPSNQNTDPFGLTNAHVSMSANGTTDGILWVIENNGLGILHAWSDSSHELYNSTQASNFRDAFAAAVSVVSPTIAGGRVYVVTKDGIAVFGQLK